METRVRYAPSPTGLQHIGSVRTALFNYLFAKSTGGKFILRIEDTDRTRTTPEAVQNLYDTFAWLGVRWDEGPDVGGPCSPYVQSERNALFQAKAEELLAKDQAYHCFCDAARLDAMRAEQERTKSGSGYDRACRSIPLAQARARVAAGEKAVVRLKVPQGGVTAFQDELLGPIEWKNEDVNRDPVLLKSDGFPTYHLANVVDDHEMGITHVLRAQEWLPSTPLHMIMYKAFGWTPPLFCHLPLVNGQDGHKLSKRHGSTSIDEFKLGGYLPEALLNYVGMLGASYEDGRDLYSLEEMGKLFSLGKLNKAPAIFDYKKLEWFNGQYIRLKADAELAKLLLPFLAASGLVTDPPSAEQAAMLAKAMPLVKERLSFLKDAPAVAAYLFKEPPLALPEDFIPKKGDKAQAKLALELLLPLLGKLEAMPEEESEAMLRALATEKGFKLGDLLMPLRVAVTGARVSPPLMGSIKALGSAACAKRVEKAIGHLG